MENKEHTLTENELKKLPPFTQSLLSHALHERDDFDTPGQDRKSTRLNSSHIEESRMPSSA